MRAVVGLEVYCQGVERIEWDAMLIVMAEQFEITREAVEQSFVSWRDWVPPVRVIFDEPWG